MTLQVLKYLNMSENISVCPLVFKLSTRQRRVVELQIVYDLSVKTVTELTEIGAPLNRFKPSSEIFCWPFQGGTSFVDVLCFCSVLCLLCLCARLFICALWSPAGKGLTSWLSFVVSYCEFVTFPLVSWVGCGT